MKEKIKLKEISNDKLCLSINSEKYEFKQKDLIEKGILLLGKKELKNYECIDYNNSLLYVFSNKGKLYITNDLNRILMRKSYIFSKIFKKNIYFYGFFSDISKKYKEYDNVFLNMTKVGVVKRPLKIGFLKNFVIIKISNDSVLKSGEIHSTVQVGLNYEHSIPIRLRKKHEGINYYSRKRLGNNYLIIRTNKNSGRVRIVNVPMSPEYLKKNLLKNFIAHLIYKPIKPFMKPIVLMFEKGTNKANESGYYIFEKIMKLKETKANVYFVIDKNSPDFEKVYKNHPKNTLIKYTFRHYLYIYLSNYFISSELSNHVLDQRLYIRSLNVAIIKKPLIFLQHGIMFAKPVDNPAASSFNKNNGDVNFYKCVISSQLEATQFYKLGFSDKDLIKCGLTKFDVSYQDPKADKIMFMPTYRYWEEGLVMNPKTTKETTYYKNFMNVIKLFEKEGLLDRLSISCHPKFVDCLIDADPIYKSIIEKDINKGLENAKIFITDYSSASYDAHYRGAYIIYDWVERDYLIENYRAIPPVNENNCDGVPVFSNADLIKEVKRAIAKNYKMDKKYEDRYKKINEFHDGKNGDRLIEELKKLNII